MPARGEGAEQILVNSSVMNFLKKLWEQLSAEEPLATEERRGSVRLDFNQDVILVVDNKDFPATIINLTFTGVCLQTSTKLTEGQGLTLRCDQFGPPFDGTVMWCQKIDGGYKVGIECELDEDKLVESWMEPALIRAGFEASYVGERRKLIRIPGRIKCDIESLQGEKISRGEILDLSLGGALVECDTEIKPGSQVRYQTIPPKPLNVMRGQASVTKARQAEGGPWLCGLRFAEPSEADLRAYMKHLRKERADS